MASDSLSEGIAARTAPALAVCLLVLALCAPGAFAASEQGDAGDLPASAQEPVGTGSLDSITGTIASRPDEDVYKVCLTGGGTFSASVGSTTIDSQLYLFNSAGKGVYANDDRSSSAVQSTLPAGHPLTPAAAGVYYLAISTYNSDPVSAGGRIFPDTPFTAVQGPTGPGGGAAISGWTHTNFDTGPYTIALTGARFCTQPDTTGPAIALTTPADGAVYARGETVLADYSCMDEAGGSGLASCTGGVADGSPIDTATLGAKSFTVDATDNAGNASSVTHTYSVVDRTAPTIALLTPPEGATYLLGEPVLADYSCADEDGGSGLASCSGSVPNGAPIDTASVGDKTFAVDALDNAGNAGTVTHSYHVVFGFQGFFSPIANRPALNSAKAGSSIPVKFGLSGDRGLAIFAAGYPRSQAILCGSSADVEGSEPTATPGAGGLTYNPGADSYHYTWKTDRSWAGSCRQLVIKLIDGSSHRANFSFK